MLDKYRKTHEFLEKSNVTRELYEAMKQDDLAEVVIQAFNFLYSLGKVEKLKKVTKSEKQSDSLLEAGLKYYSNRKYKSALESYNKALAFAPPNSDSLILAYIHRSAVFFKLRQFQACVSDIDRCFSLACPEEIKEELIKSREEANKHIMEEAPARARRKEISKNFFNFSSTCHPDLPSVSKNINVNLKSSEVKITAGANIKSGTIISIEDALMTTVSDDNLQRSCFYCLKSTPALIPCNKCCTAFFCSDRCKNVCYDEYHIYECEMIDIINTICIDPRQKLMIKTVFKLKRKLKWNDFIKLSKTIGNSLTTDDTLKETLHSDSIRAVLSSSENRVFIYGVMYNASFLCAELLNYIFELPYFLPSYLLDQYEAIAAIARIMIHLCIYSPKIHVLQSATNIIANNSIDFQVKPNFAWYAFYNKVKRSCTPNVLVSWIRNKAVLRTKRNINPGEEIVTTDVKTFNNTQHRKTVLSLRCRGTLDSCEHGTQGHAKGRLSLEQLALVRKVNLYKLRENLRLENAREIFEKACQVLDALSNVPFSRPYCLAIKVFLTCKALFEAELTENVEL